MKTTVLKEMWKTRPVPPTRMCRLETRVEVELGPLDLGVAVAVADVPGVQQQGLVHPGREDEGGGVEEGVEGVH
jgi:hypothetical protein